MITTDRQVQALKPKFAVYWEGVKSPHGGGLAVRVSPGGAKGWYFRYRFNGKQDSYTLGRYPAVSLQDARDAHGQARRSLADGINPKRAQRQRKAVNQAAWTMQELFSKWIVSYAATPSVHTKRRPSAKVVEQTRWRWGFYLKRQLGDFLIKSVDRSHLTAAIADVAETQSREQARKCLSLVKGMLDFAEARGQVETSPAAGIQPSKLGASPSAPRKRYLDLPELRRLWVAVEQTGLSPSVAAAIRFLMLTGQRRGELQLAEWGHIDWESRIWTIPAPNAKNRKRHDVHLSDQALRLLRSLERRGRFVFESERIWGQPIGANSITTAVLRIQGRKTRQRNADALMSDVEPFSVHDLRRSVATGLGAHCAIQPHVVERMLNHVDENKLIQTYQRGEYFSEQVLGWQKWGDLIEALVAEGSANVALPSSVDNWGVVDKSGVV